MLTFYLNLRAGDQLIADLEGGLYASIAAANAEAITGAREILCEQMRAGHLDLSQQFEIADSCGAVVSTIVFRDALK